MKENTMDTNDTTPVEATEPEQAEAEATDTKAKKSKPKRLNVLVLRAVDGYHHRGAVISVPNDEYHAGLLKQGNLKAVD